jgi:hypothetical protein
MNPERPAIVRDFNESLCKRIKARFAVVLERYKANFEDAITLGRELRDLRKACNAGQWYPTLEKTTVPKTTAATYITCAEIADYCGSVPTARPISSFRSINEAMDYWQNEIGGAQEDGKPAKVKLHCIFCQDAIDKGGEAAENCGMCAAERDFKKAKKKRRDDGEPALTFSAGSLSIHAKMMLKQIDNIVADFQVEEGHPEIMQLRDQLRGWVLSASGLRDRLKRGEDPAQIARRAFTKDIPPNGTR